MYTDTKAQSPGGAVKDSPDNPRSLLSLIGFISLRIYSESLSRAAADEEKDGFRRET